ncbi:MAG: response regulator [Bacteriovoracia bacterium]
MSNKILIIEDDLDTQFLFTEILEEEGYRVISKININDALEFCNTHPLPDMIFLDLNFPDGTPEEFTKEFRKIPGTSKIPIVLISGKADIADYAKRLGAKSFLRKPFEIDPLLNLVSSFI